MPNSKFSFIFIFIILSPFLFSCNDKSNTDKTILTVTDATLKNSNLSVYNSSTTILASIRNRAADPMYRERAQSWLPIVELLTKLSSELVNNIENLKSEKKVSSKQSKELYNVLIKYRNDILNLDSAFRYEFEKYFTHTIIPYDTIENGESKFYSKFFKKASGIATKAMLSNIQNNARVIENKLLSFCHSKTTYHIIHDYFPSALVTQNSANLKNGDILEIKAGIGSFSKELNLSAAINGKRIQIGEEGYFTYKKKILGSPGRYKIPVKISFLNNTTGKSEEHKITVEYTVVKECNQ